MRNHTIIYFLLVGMLLSLQLKGQDTLQSENHPDTKHEVSIDFAPIFSLMDLNMSQYGFYFSYKYNTEKLKYRVAFTSRGQNNSSGYNEFEQIIIGDTLIRMSDIHYNRSRQFFHLGVEKERCGDPFDLYGGVDLLFGSQSESHSVTESDFIRNEEGVYVLSNSQIPVSESYFTDYLSFGICPFIGVDMNLNERIAVGMMIPAYLFYSIPVETDLDIMPEGRIDFNENIQFMLRVKL